MIVCCAVSGEVQQDATTVAGNPHVSGTRWRAFVSQTL